MMKRLLGKIALIAFTVFAFTSCEKDDDAASENTGSVSFNAVLNEMMNSQTRQEVTDLPDCSDADPAYVDVVVTGPVNIGSVAAPYRVDLVDSGGAFITGEDEELSNIPAGSYELIYFVVYDAENNPIWIAPSAGNFEDYVAEPLPQSFDVESGVDNEVSVDVACFENRVLNEFGNLFFSLNSHRAIEFCIVGNTCGAGDASFSTTVYSGSDDTGSLLYMDMTNTAGEALCMTLPDLEGEDQYYFEISMNGSVIRSGVITDADVKAFHDGDTNIDPYIFYEGDACTSADSPDLFAAGGGDTGGGTGTAIDYAETFEGGEFLADLMYATEALAGQTVANAGSWQTHNKADSYASLTPFYNNPEDPDNADDSDWGIQYRYKYDSTDGGFTSTGAVDNVMISPVFETTGGDYNFSFDISFSNPGNNTGTVTAYYSNTYSGGAFNEADWTVVETVTASDIAEGRTFWARMVNSISPSGDFYLAFRIEDQIGDGTTANDVTQWRVDNIQVSGGAIDGGTGGGDTGGGDTGATFSDYIETFEAYDPAGTYTESYLNDNGWEMYYLASHTEAIGNSGSLDADENAGKYTDVDDVSMTSDKGIDLFYNGDANEAYGTIDVVRVTPGQADASGNMKFNVDSFVQFPTTDGTITYYYATSANYTPGDGFDPSVWTELGSDATQDVRSWTRKDFDANIGAIATTVYFAVRFNVVVTDGGDGPGGTEGNYRARGRFDNFKILDNN